jgi:D-alanyl-D-alanine carboxypeptidase/D-alanyl-D-alanine-endopeptidase (penicillin-binding protein 4)
MRYKVKSRHLLTLAMIVVCSFPYRAIALEKQDLSLVCPANLKETIDRIVERPEWQRSRWGIKVQLLGQTRTLYEREADRYFIPASNLKLLTTAAVFLKFGQNYRFQTPVYYDRGQLTIIGQGDPSLTAAQLNDLAQRLKKQGIRQIQALIVQDNTSSEQWLNGSWEWSDLAFYFAPSVSQLNLNQNQVTLTLTPSRIGQPLQEKWSDPIAAFQWQIRNQTQTTPPDSANTLSILPIFGSQTLAIAGSLAQNAEGDRTRLAIPNPPQYFLDSLQSILQQQAISVDRVQISQKIDIKPQNLLMTLNSPPLLDLIALTNQESNNLYAEALLNLLGQNADRFAALKKQLQSLGIEGDRYQIVDGSGLSRQNLVPPSVFVNLLQGMAQAQYGQAFRASLAIAGESGTLHAYKDTPLAGKIQAKTGTLKGIYALSGYLDSKSGPTLVFSIILNQSTQPPSASRQAIQDILLRLYHLQDCS